MKTVRITLTLLLSLCILGCDGDPYSGFGAICTEGHPAVSHARSLSEEQLAFAYKEIYRLREENSESKIEYEDLKGTIPDNLKFLKAARIRPSSPNPNIMLAGCMDEFIYLRFYELESEDSGIVLSWAAGTNENPYKVGRLHLWRPNK